VNLKDYVRGWIIGDFEPSVLRTKILDFGVAHFVKGEKHAAHHHKRSTEYNVVVTGVHIIGDKEYRENDICIIYPNESVSYECVETGALAVVKIPTGKGDKYEDTCVDGGDR